MTDSFSTRLRSMFAAGEHGGDTSEWVPIYRVHSGPADQQISIAVEQPSRPEGLATAIATFRSFSFFIAVYLYFAGWLFTYHLFSHFGIGTRSADVPPYSAFLYADSVVGHNWPYYAVATLFLLFIGAARQRLNKAYVPILALTAIAGFPFVHETAFNAAESEAYEMRLGLGLKPVRVYSDSVARTRFSDSAFWTANDSLQLLLFHQTEKNYLLLRQPLAETGLPVASMYILPRELVTAIAVSVN